MKAQHQVLLFIAYLVSARLGMTFAALQPENIAIIWLPSGIALFGLIRFGHRALPSILIGAIAAVAPDLLQPDTSAELLRTSWHALVSAVIHTTQSVIAYAIYRRLIPNGVLHDMPGFMIFAVGVSVLPSMITAWMFVLNLVAGGYVNLDNSTEWKTLVYNLTLAHAMGVFLLIPLVESVKTFKMARIQRIDVVRFAFMLLFLGVVFSWLFFRETGYPVALTLPLTAIALTGGLLGTSVAFTVVSLTGIVLTLNGVGPFIVSMSATSAYGLIFAMIGLGIPSYLIAISTHNSLKLTYDLEKRVNARTKELAELNRNKDHLMSIIAHDLRNPIQGIIGVSDLMRQDVQAKDFTEMGTYSEMIHNSSKQVLQLLYNLLDWSATQSGLMRFTPKWIDLNILVEDNFAYYKEMADSKSIRLKTDIPLRYQACVDPKMMATILRNLTSNALKFTPAGGTVQIKVTTLESNGFRLSVTDSGIGMTGDQQADLFRMDEGIQPKRGTNGEIGSGLGLVLCKTFIDKHNGQLSIYSEPGKGSEFHLTFPSISPETT